MFTPDGFLRTADIGTMDDQGYFTVVDRIKDLILCGGYNVYPRMVEEAIYRHPAVSACTVIGIPDDYRGETVKAFVMRKPGETLDAETLTRFLRDYLSAIEMPKQIEFRDSLPMTLVGKLSKKELVEEERAKRAG
jgi:long-chain acyl-CoA synthetase